MIFRKKEKPRERFYLLPGQGGRNYYRKQRVLIGWSIVVALILGAVMASVMYWLAHQRL